MGRYLLLEKISDLPIELRSLDSRLGRLHLSKRIATRTEKTDEKQSEYFCSTEFSFSHRGADQLLVIEFASLPAVARLADSQQECLNECSLPCMA